jgi:UDP-N-acetylglucosamine 3-dehydrogenase
MRLGMVGTGFIAGVHADAARSVPAVELAGAVGGRPASAERFVAAQADAHPALRAYPDLAGLLDAVDAVVVATPTDTHEPIVRRCLDAGRHVLVEKPMALTEAECARMEAARPQGIVLAVGHVLRYWPEYRVLRHLAGSGRFGALRLATFSRRCALPDWSPWFRDHERSGGAVTDLLVHDLDMALELVGGDATVAATGRRGASGGIDQAYVSVTGSSARAVVECFAVEAPGYPFTAEYRAVFDDAVVEMYSRATAQQIDSLDGTSVTAYPRGGGAERLPVPGGDAYAEQLAAFADACARGEAPPDGTPDQARATVRAVASIRKILEEER